MRKGFLILHLAAFASLAACKASGTPPTTTTTPPASTAAADSASAQASASAPATATATAPATASATATSSGPAQKTDTIVTAAGPLDITPIHHATLLFQFGGKNIYLDPAADAGLDGLPKADYVFVTDIHPDHLDPASIDKIKGATTIVVGPPAVDEKRKVDVVLKNGDKHDFGAFSVEAVPMYNLVRGPSAGKLFHDKGRGDGFVFTFGGKRVYVSGDTECVPEMKALPSIDVAFVCMNLPYTMPPTEAAACVKAFRPKVVFPYHHRDSNLDDFTNALKGEQGIDVRIRRWY